MAAGGDRERFVLALDVGTTSVRAHVYNSLAQHVASDSRKIELLYPQPGWVEMDQEVLWQQTQDVIKGSLTAANLEAKDISCMGITCLRNTFITWDKETGEPFHRFITWQDLRASDLVKSWTNSFTMKAFTGSTNLLHTVTRRSRFLAASVLRFKSAQVTLRLIWQIKNDPKLRQRVEEKQVMYGAIDTYLVWKLTGGRVFATDYSNASSTGFYDPFTMEYSGILTWLVGMPLHILPEIRDTSGDFGETEAHLFGAPISITAVVADQQAAMFGQCCFEVGDVKCTMGTGTFIDCNTGNKPHASIAGLYPLIGWKIKKEIVFIAEGFSSDTGLCIEWAMRMGLVKDVTQLSDHVQTVPDSGGTYFIPAFNGLQAPINDDKACCSIIGINQATSPAHLMRAMLESLAFRFKLLYETILHETKTPLSGVCNINQATSPAHLMRAMLESLAFRFKLLYETILHETKTPLSGVCKCDGGVCNNDFLVQLCSDLIDVPMDRPEHMETTSLGAAFLAGLAVGVWKDKEELKALRATQRVFTPNKRRRLQYHKVLEEWKRAVKRTRDWHRVVAS